MITIMAAVAENNALGNNNQLIWHLPADLKRFKKLTLGHHVIMGRKTFESLGKPLPHRITIIITRNPGYKATGCIVVNSLEEALQAAAADDNPFILGGAEIYAQAMEIADHMDITHIHHSFDADAFFPPIDAKIWKEISREDHPANDRNPYPYSFVQYKKK